jgi:hypothetical protein
MAKAGRSHFPCPTPQPTPHSMPRLAYEPSRCVVCGHADANPVVDADGIRDEIALLWEFHGRRLRLGTPVSHLTDRVAFSEPPAYRFVECRECGLVYRNPVERAHNLRAAYATAPVDERVHRALLDAQLPACRAQAKRLLGAMGRGGSVLEVGSYVGGFLSAARELGLVTEGVDINPATNALTRRLGFHVHDGDFLEVPIAPAARRLDAIAVWNTFDQLADPRGAVLRAWGLLRDGGILAIRVPNGAVYRRHRGRAVKGRGGFSRLLLAHNNLLAFPYRFGFTPGSLARLLSEAGFEQIRVHGDVLSKVSDAWTRPWARAEERIIAAAIRSSIARRADRAPWIEVYAIRGAAKPPRASVDG